MKNRYYKKSKHKHNLISDLFKEQRRGKKFIYRKLTIEDATSVGKIFSIEEEKIIIKTKPIPNFKNSKHLLKEIHHCFKAKKKFLIINYRSDACDLLEENRIFYEIKYKIILN